MSRVKDYILALVGLLGMILGIWILLSPATFPISLAIIHERLETVTNEIVLSILLGGILLVGWILRRIGSTKTSVNRSPIVDTDPESVPKPLTRTADPSFAEVYREGLAALEEPTKADRRLVMFGRKAKPHVKRRTQVETVIDELTITARDAYAAAEQVSEDHATRAVNDGSWTANDTAATFLSKNVENAPKTRVHQRLIAWLIPERAFRKRVRRTIDAIESVGDVYLTYPRLDQPGEET